MKNHYYFMKRALALARRGRGKTSPNPLVGAVLVKGGIIIGEGYHENYGSAHAEAEAMNHAIEPVKGATLYCTLEPCSFTSPEKHNPPCTDRIIREGIKRVVIATLDPNQRVNGSGVGILSEAGIEVITGVMEGESKRLNESYNRWMISKKPFVHMKIAQSLDGRIATGIGNSKWITDETAREEVHDMRNCSDAVLVGINTVIMDDPSLLVKKSEGIQPVRIVLDRRLKIPLNARLLTDTDRTIIITGEKTDFDAVKKLRSDKVSVLQVEEVQEGLNLEKVLLKLGEMNIASVLVEGGGKIFTSFFKQNLWDKVSVFIAPIVIGKGISTVGDLGITRLSEAIGFTDISYRTIGNQIVFEGYRQEQPSEGREAADVHGIG